MSIRKLSAIFIAISMLFASSLAGASAAAAAMPDHHMQTMESGHCTMPPSGDHDKAPAKSCCIAMCMGLAVTPSAPLIERAPQQAPAVFAIPTEHPGYLAEIATPPPRQA